jgi:hypothetical protein
VSSEPAARIASFAEFWPFYISQHRDARCRVVHFVGTNGFALLTLGCLWSRPWVLGPVLLAIAAVIALSFRMESRRNAAPVLIGAIIAAIVAHPAMLGAVAFAYAWAWAGHFLIEGNRPATFTYPLWSFAGDFRMCGQMWAGKLWKGRADHIAPDTTAPLSASAKAG